MEPRTFDRAGVGPPPAAEPTGWRRVVWLLGGAILAGLAALLLRRSQRDDEKPVTRVFLPGEAIVALRRRAGQPRPGPAEARAVVAHLNRALLRQGSALQVALAEESPPGDETGDLPRRASFVFGDDERASRHWLLWLTVPGYGGGEREDDFDAVKDVVDLLNEQLAGRFLDNLGYVVAAMPNWLAVSTPPNQSEGGPGAPPRAISKAMLAGLPTAADPNPFPVTFLNSPALLADLDAAGPGNGVTVVVLDAAPTRDRVATAASATGNAALASLLDGQLTELRTVPPLPALPLVATDGQRYRMADHGLFVAGLIHAVAPRATITLWRVLNDDGVGCLASLLNGLVEAFALPGPVVVNLSLVLTVPIEELEAIWGSRHGKAGARPVTCTTRSLFDRGLAGVFGPLGRDGRLIVAAAGNDSLNLSDRLEPRYPARYDTVLAVAALAGNGQPASYANEGDAPAAINGVATFGGNARQIGSQVLIPDNTVSGHPSAPPTFPDAPIGLVTSQLVPERASAPAATDQPNETGWAAWAGSSFATPLVSGVAARLLSGKPTLAADEAIATITAYATDGTADPELKVNGIRAIQF